MENDKAKCLVGWVGLVGLMLIAGIGRRAAPGRRSAPAGMGAQRAGVFHAARGGGPGLSRHLPRGQAGGDRADPARRTDRRRRRRAPGRHPGPVGLAAQDDRGARWTAPSPAPRWPCVSKKNSWPTACAWSPAAKPSASPWTWKSPCRPPWPAAPASTWNFSPRPFSARATISATAPASSRCRGTGRWRATLPPCARCPWPRGRSCMPPAKTRCAA